MNAALIRIDEVVAQPWRNGGGLTRELLAWPAPQHWAVRVSVADVAADGPFSVFGGTRRWFAVLEGDGVELTVDGKPHRIVRGAEPLGFSGEATTACRLLGGPTRDLNLMLRQARGGMAPVRDGGTWSPQAACCGLFAATPGRCLAAGDEFDVPAGALLWFGQAPERLLFTAAQPGADLLGYWLAATPTGVVR